MAKREKPNSKARKGIMWASSRMGLRGFRVSLTRTATKEDWIEVQFSATEITSCYRHAKHGTFTPLPRLEGRVTPLCRLYWGLPLDRIRYLVSVPKHGI